MKDQEIKECWCPAKYIRPNGDVLDFTWLYEVSDQGRVRSLNYHGTGKIKVLSYGTYKDKSNDAIYYMVTLCLAKKHYVLPVHRIVLSSFKESEFFEGAVCDHIVSRSETCCDNRLNNLRWVTSSQNRSTEHCRVLQSKNQANQLSTSKRTKVTDLTTGETTVYPSANEANRILGLPSHTVSVCIFTRNGLYKKMNLMFEYIE